jgi:hypothetical protein
LELHGNLDRNWRPPDCLVTMRHKSGVFLLSIAHSD